ncbi:hypothetical protein JQN19_25335, partial [Escherichia coli]
RCGRIIEKTTLSSRPFYWCPGCQHYAGWRAISA